MGRTTLNPRRQQVRTSSQKEPCPSCKRVRASSWRKIAALEGDDRNYCNPCYQHHLRHGQLPDPTTIFMMAHMSTPRMLYTPEESVQEPCPNCSTTTSTCWLRIRSRGQQKYCVDCYLKLHPKHGEPRVEETPPLPEVAPTKPRTRSRKRTSPPPIPVAPKVSVSKPKRKWPPRPSRTGLPCPWCKGKESSYWRLIKSIGDGKYYCNTCTSYFYMHKKLKQEHLNRFADDE